MTNKRDNLQRSKQINYLGISDDAFVQRSPLVEIKIAMTRRSWRREQRKENYRINGYIGLGYGHGVP